MAIFKALSHLANKRTKECQEKYEFIPIPVYKIKGFGQGKAWRINTLNFCSKFFWGLSVGNKGEKLTFLGYITGKKSPRNFRTKIQSINFRSFSRSKTLYF